MPALLAPSSLSHPATRPSPHCPSHGPAGPLCQEGNKSTASTTAERALCCSARGEAPALPRPRHQPHPCFCRGLQTRGHLTGRADPPTASWAGACRGAAEPPPRPDSSCGCPLPPICPYPSPLTWRGCRGWDPREGQEGAPLPVGLTPVSREGQHQGRKSWRRDGWQARPSGSGRAASKVGRASSPQSPGVDRGAAQRRRSHWVGWGGRILPHQQRQEGSQGRGQGHTSPPAHPHPGLICPALPSPSWDQTWHLKEPCLLSSSEAQVQAKQRQSLLPTGSLEKGPVVPSGPAADPHVTLAQGSNLPALSSRSPNSFSPAQVTHS